MTATNLFMVSVRAASNSAAVVGIGLLDVEGDVFELEVTDEISLGYEASVRRNDFARFRAALRSSTEHDI